MLLNALMISELNEGVSVMNNAMWILVGLLVSQHVVAGQVTITNPGQEETENSKTLLFIRIVSTRLPLLQRRKAVLMQRPLNLKIQNDRLIN